MKGSKKKESDAAKKASAAMKQVAEEEDVTAAESEVDDTAEAGAETVNQAELAAVSDRLIRLQADFENYRKRMLREKNETYRKANEDIMLELLPVLDHMELALEAAGTHDTNDGFVEGVRLVSEQFISALNKFGLTAIDAADTEFDPNYHEAVSHIPSPDVAENHVITQLRKGFTLGDQLLRPAQVVVSSGSAQAEEETNE